MSIGILGGSFNPIHRGHLSLAQSLIDQKILDEVWLMVAPLNPLKRGQEEDIAPFRHRFEMAQLAASHYRDVWVEDFESRLPPPYYTYNTLTSLTKRFPFLHPHLVMGADNWKLFPRWYKHEAILKEYPIVVYARPGVAIDKQGAPSTVRFVETELYDISSTRLRDMIRRGEDTSEWLPDYIRNYIDSWGLYRPKSE